MCQSIHKVQIFKKLDTQWRLVVMTRHAYNKTRSWALLLLLQTLGLPPPPGPQAGTHDGGGQFRTPHEEPTTSGLKAQTVVYWSPVKSLSLSIFIYERGWTKASVWHMGCQGLNSRPYLEDPKCYLLSYLWEGSTSSNLVLVSFLFFFFYFLSFF